MFKDTDCLFHNGKLCLCISVTQSVSVIQGHGLSTLLREIMSMYFSHPECLHYSGTWTVYFIVGNYVYIFRSVTRSVFIIQGHGLSTLLWDKDCLHCSGTWSPKEDKVSTLLCHRECLLCHGIRLHYYGIASSLVCQSDLSTLVCLVSSLVLAPEYLTK